MVNKYLELTPSSFSILIAVHPVLNPSTGLMQILNSRIPPGSSEGRLADVKESKLAIDKSLIEPGSD